MNMKQNVHSVSGSQTFRAGVCVAVLTLVAGSAFAVDEPSTATNVTTYGTISGSTVSATASATNIADCGAAAGSRDTWYRLLAPTSESIIVGLCTSTTSWDSVVQVFSAEATGGPGALVACSNGGCVSETGHAAVAVNVDAGRYYLIRVVGATPTVTGTFNLTIGPGVINAPLVRAEGTDGVIGQISDGQVFGAGTVNGETVRSFAWGTRTWNIGNRPLRWTSSTSEHPVIGGNMYRATSTRFEQIGAGWMKHGFAVANGTFDAGFGACVVSGASGTLGVNCSDPYGAGINGGQSRLGPRFDMNPTTGAFTAGWTSLVPAFSGALDRRVQVRNSDLAVPGARYYAECFVFAPDDSLWGNSRNNFSARRLAAFPTWTGSSQSIGFSSDTYRASALEMWAAENPSTVRITRVDFHERTTTFNDTWNPWTPGQTTITTRAASPVTRDQWTRYIGTSAVTDNGNGTWTYEYALKNVNSDRGVAEIVFGPLGGTISDAALSMPSYHSGDRTRNAPWQVSAGSSAKGGVTFAAVQQTEAVTYPAPLGTVTFQPNNLMFGMTASYRLTSTQPPMIGNVKLRLAKPAAGPNGYQGQWLTLTGMHVPQRNLADIAGANQAVGPDGQRTADDIIVFLGAFFANDIAMADLGSTNQGTTPDNELSADDILIFLNAYFAE